MSQFRDLPYHLSTRYWKLIFVSMLVLLHFAAIRGMQDMWARAFMLAHCGLFIVWQPLLQNTKALRLSHFLLIFAAAFAIFVMFNWWLLGVWVAMLAGLIGGKVFIFQRRWNRAFHLLVLAYLVALLLIWVVPNSFAQSRLDPAMAELAVWGLPALFVLMALLPVETDTSEPQIVDLFYATLLFLLLVVIVLGSFAFMTVGNMAYGLAVAYSVITLGLVLIVLSFVWNPRAGFAGLSVFFSRYLLSIGLPFEQWLHFLAELSRTESQPEQFVRKACQELAKLQWVTGGHWKAGKSSGEFGTRTAFAVDFMAPELEIRVHSRLRPSPALVWHLNVLGRLLAQFYVAKQRETQLRQQSYVQAVHETGARLTHDVKNLLQSLNVLCSAAQQEDVDSVSLQAMIRRNLPVISQRLQHTLDKLQKPTVETGRFIRPEVWWEQLQRTYQHPAVSFQAQIQSGAVPVPRDLFETAADNLINNALEKRKTDPDVVVRVRFECGERVSFSVSDSGHPVNQDVERSLFQGPVASNSGYGIGLFQVYRQAEATGFRLKLASNQPGNVRFELAAV